MWKPTKQNEPAVSVIWAGKIGECKEYDDSLHSERQLRGFGENIGCDCKENGNSLQSRIRRDSQLLKRPCGRMRHTSLRA